MEVDWERQNSNKFQGQSLNRGWFEGSRQELRQCLNPVIIGDI